MKLYLAAMYAKMAEMALIKTRLENYGFEITAQWIEGKDNGAIEGAQMDLDDIDRSDLVLVFTNAPKTMFSGGGRFVEMGYAIAKGKRVAVIGDHENVFCYLAPVYPTIEHFLANKELKL